MKPLDFKCKFKEIVKVFNKFTTFPPSQFKAKAVFALIAMSLSFLVLPQITIEELKSVNWLRLMTAVT
jgi:hypothetical protein